MRNRKTLILLDALTIFTAFLLGYFYRFYSPVFPEKGIAPLLPYIQMTAFGVSCWILIFYAIGLYRERLFFNFCHELCLLIKGTFWAMMFLMAGTFFYRGFLYSRLAIGFGSIFAFLLLWIFHYIYIKIEKPGRKKVMVIGDNNGIKILLKRFKMHSSLKFNISIFPSFDITKLEKEILKKKPDFIIASIGNSEESLQMQNFAQKHRIKLYLLPKIHQFFFSGEVENIDGIPLLTLWQSPLEKFPAVILKKFIDLLFGLAFFLLFSIILPFIALLIKFKSKGPVFFKQERVGKDGKTFKIFKFRTMKYPYNPNPPFTLLDDPRFTKVGMVLRKYNLDELPQIFNVLNGDMSLVGPRPISLKDTFFFSLPDFSFRVRVKPGITGWAQIHGLRGGHTEPNERLQYDLYYLENWSIWLDLGILLSSLFSFKNAY